MSVKMGILASIITEAGKLAADLAWKRLSRDEKVLRLLEAADLKPERPRNDFDSVYAYSLVELAVEVPNDPALNFFRKEAIKAAFKRCFSSGESDHLFEEAKRHVNWEEARDDVRYLIRRFSEIFDEMTDKTCSPGQIRDHVMLEKILRKLENGTSEGDSGDARRELLLTDYLNDVIADTESIDIQGIYGEPGSVAGASSFSIEEHYTPLRTTGPPESSRAATFEELAEGERSERTTLTEALRSCRRLLIVGEPGGGKTTFLRFIACVLAKDAMGRVEPRRKDLIGLDLDQSPPVPIYMRITALSTAARSACSDACAGSGWRVLLQAMEAVYGLETGALLQGLLDAGECALLLDGLDEEPDPTLRTRIVSITQSVLAHWGDNLVVISSRPFGYQAVSNIRNLDTVHIDKFNEPEIMAFLRRWAHARFPDEQERRRNRYLPILREEVLSVPRIRRMATNPVMLTCLCVVHWNQRKLPEGKVDLLMAVLRWMIEAKEEKRRARGFNGTFAGECLKALALAMTEHAEGKQVQADIAWAAEQLEVPFRDELGIEGDAFRRRGMDFLEAEMIDSGIVEQTGRGQLRFWHFTFQEHYAGAALADKDDGDGVEGWWAHIAGHLDDRQWDEVLDHFTGCLAKRGRKRLHQLVERILKTSIDLPSLARAVGVLGRLLKILEAYDYQPPKSLGWASARQQVMAIFTEEGARVVDVNQRIDAAEALGRSGDPRLLPLAPEMLPVPDLEGVLLGRYPVVVSQYSRFVEEGGYSDRQFWKDDWQTRQKAGWKEPKDWPEQIDHGNRPVTRVSWYEAMAYCRWLSKKTGASYRLPTSEGWEKAAVHPRGGDYPWGETEPSEEHLNFRRNVGRPTPVGVYPMGGAHGGHMDMAGNVWEWTSTKLGAGRVIRGGSWFLPAEYCHSAFRGRLEPGSRDFGVGFRLTRSS